MNIVAIVNKNINVTLRMSQDFFWENLIMHVIVKRVSNLSTRGSLIKTIILPADKVALHYVYFL